MLGVCFEPEGAAWKPEGIPILFVRGGEPDWDMGLR
jgi:hypothetical protein